MDRRLARASIAVPLLLACGELLGIDDARVDPRLSPGGRSGAPSVAGSPGAPSAAGALGVPSGGRGGNTASEGASGGSPEEGGTPSSTERAGSPNAGAAGRDEAGGSGGDGPTLCDQYCSTIGEYCQGDQLQYGDAAQCRKVCALFPEGTIGGPDGNTVACRLKYASKARYAGGLELSVYCRGAGPGGDGRCGSNCEGFCTIAMATCTSEIQAPSYASFSQCMNTCEKVPTTPFIWGDPSVADGNTLECRLFHVLYAVMRDSEEHCEHAYGVTLCEPQ